MPIAHSNLFWFQASSRISSLLQKPAVISGNPASEAAPTTKVTNVIGIVRRRPPMRRTSKLFVAWLTEPAPRKSSALKQACVSRWKIAAT